MRLCFGTFATLLNHCRQNTTQAAFIAKIVNIVDPKSRYCGEDMAGDGPAITKLLSCKIDFAFSERTADILSLGTVIERFETDISPFIDEDKKGRLIIALLSLIKNDNCIDSEKKESFIKYFGLKKQQLLQQSSFIFSDLLGRALLYTVYGNINNQVGKEYVQTITDDYINNTAKPYTHELQWDFYKHTLTLLHVQMFQIFSEVLLKNQIFEFIDSVGFSGGCKKFCVYGEIIFTDRNQICKNLLSNSITFMLSNSFSDNSIANPLSFIHDFWFFCMPIRH